MEEVEDIVIRNTRVAEPKIRKFPVPEAENSKRRSDTKQMKELGFKTKSSYRKWQKNQRRQQREDALSAGMGGVELNAKS